MGNSNTSRYADGRDVFPTAGQAGIRDPEPGLGPHGVVARFRQFAGTRIKRRTLAEAAAKAGIEPFEKLMLDGADAPPPTEVRDDGRRDLLRAEAIARARRLAKPAR